MLINLSDVFQEQGKELCCRTKVELEQICFMGMEYKILRKTDADWTITNLEPGKARIRGTASVVFNAPCDRCLKEVEVVMELHTERFVLSPEKPQEDDEVDDLSFMDGYNLDTETLLYNEMIENWPAKILCKEDCLGLCTVCGKNLNEGDCGCDRFVPDPRMAAIKDVFNACKEV